MALKLRADGSLDPESVMYLGFEASLWFNDNRITYIDSEFGHHYAVDKSGLIIVKDKEEMITRLKDWLNR